MFFVILEAGKFKNKVPAESHGGIFSAELLHPGGGEKTKEDEHCILTGHSLDEEQKQLKLVPSSPFIKHCYS